VSEKNDTKKIDLNILNFSALQNQLEIKVALSVGYRPNWLVSYVVIETRIDLSLFFGRILDIFKDI